MTSIYNNSLASLYGTKSFTNPYSSNLGALDLSGKDDYSSLGSLSSLYDIDDYSSFGTDAYSRISYGSSNTNASKTALLQQNRELKRLLLKAKEDAKDSNKDLLGLDPLFADSEGKGGVRVADIGIGALATIVFQQLLGSGKDGKDGGLFGGLGKIFGG